MWREIKSSIPNMSSVLYLIPVRGNLKWAVGYVVVKLRGSV